MAQTVTPADMLAARDRAIADKAWIRSLMYANARNRSDDPARWSPIFTATILDYAPASRQNRRRRPLRRFLGQAGRRGQITQRTP